MIPLYYYAITLGLVRNDTEILLPGDITPVEEKVKISTAFEQEGSINSVFVYVLSRTTDLMNNYSKDFVGVTIRDMSPTSSLLTSTELKISGDINYETGLQYSIIYGYLSADKQIEYSLDGIFISHVYRELNDELPVGGKLTHFDGEHITSLTQFYDFVDANDSATFTVDGKDYYVEKQDYYGTYMFGMRIKPNYIIETEQKYEIENSSVRGSSGGLLQALSIYNQLTEFDYSYGKVIAGTGTLSADGYVGNIGGIRQKIIAADREGVDIFFLPIGNYEDALDEHQRVESNMILVPVSTFNDAISFLEGYDE